MARVRRCQAMKGIVTVSVAIISVEHCALCLVVQRGALHHTVVSMQSTTVEWIAAPRYSVLAACFDKESVYAYCNRFSDLLVHGIECEHTSRH